MKRGEFLYHHTLRVRYSEIDAQGVVFNAHYLTYFDTALNEFMRALKYDYQGLVEREGLDFHLVKATVEYLAPIHFDEQIDVAVRVGKIGRTSLTWELGVFRTDEDICLTRGEIVWVCSKIGTHKSHPLPADFVELLS